MQKINDPIEEWNIDRTTTLNTMNTSNTNEGSSSTSESAHLATPPTTAPSDLESMAPEAPWQQVATKESTASLMEHGPSNGPSQSKTGSSGNLFDQVLAAATPSTLEEPSGYSFDIELEIALSAAPSKEKRQQKRERKRLGVERERTEYVHNLRRLYSQLQDSSNQSKSISSIHLPPLQIKSTAVKLELENFYDISVRINRDRQHIRKYVETELSTQCSFTAEQNLVVFGKYSRKMVNQVLARYIRTYVVCQTCKSMATSFARDVASRIDQVHCSSCHASRAVPVIKDGYKAMTSKDRAKERM